MRARSRWPSAGPWPRLPRRARAGKARGAGDAAIAARGRWHRGPAAGSRSERLLFFCDAARTDKRPRTRVSRPGATADRATENAWIFLAALLYPAATWSHDRGRQYRATVIAGSQKRFVVADSG